VHHRALDPAADASKHLLLLPLPIIIAYSYSPPPHLFVVVRGRVVLARLQPAGAEPRTVPRAEVSLAARVRDANDAVVVFFGESEANGVC
jgi:hypothetical protein